MKKIFSLLLIAAGLMISAQTKADNTVSLTIGETVTEYATLEQAVAAAETAGEGIIKLLPAYDRYPQAWLTDLTGVEEPTGFADNDKGLFTFHAFNPSGDNALFDKVKAKQNLTPEERTRALQVVREINPALISVPDAMIDLTVDIQYLGGYADWTSDFEVYFDADFAEDEYTLVGNYGDWGWYPNDIYTSLSKDMAAYERIALLSNDYLPKSDNNLHYWELMTTVNHFHCGIVGKDKVANAGKTFWCELYLYYPGNKNIKLLMDRTPYTFPIRPVVVHSQAEVTSENADEIAELKEENAGVKAMTDAQTNIYPATSEFEPLAEKCIVVVLTDVQITSVGEVYEQDTKVVTYEVTPKYVSEDGTLTLIPNSEITAPIKFRLPVLAEYAGKKVAIYHKANDAAEEDYLGLYQVQELSGSYYVELSAQSFSKYLIKSVNNFYERETSNGMIGTICVPYDIVADSLANAGATFFEINYRDNAVTTQVTVVEGPQVTALEGGKAYVFYATGNLVHVGWAPESEAKSVVTTGTLVGNLSATPIYPATLYAAGTVEPYVITNTGVFRPCGSGAYVPMNRAYLNMAKVPTTKNAPGRCIRLSANGADVITGIEEVQNAQFRMQSGKMILNGQFVIIRDGKMFNAVGQEL